MNVFKELSDIMSDRILNYGLIHIFKKNTKPTL